MAGQKKKDKKIKKENKKNQNCWVVILAELPDGGPRPQSRSLPICSDAQ